MTSITLATQDFDADSISECETPERTVSRRRTNATEGCVNFPLNTPSTKEGGMFVKLWVVDNRDYGESYGICCGVLTHELKMESLMGSDKLRRPEHPCMLGDWEKMSPEELMAEYEKDNEANKAFESFFYAVEREDGDSLSTGLLASILMGSTGWSGDFICTYDDLTPQGQALYQSMQALYPQAELHLVTFLDT